MKLSTHKYVISQEELETVVHQGQDHWVVPVIMMIEGVHSGSAGPLLYTAEELGNYAMAWDGTAVVVGHPSNKDGDPVSANSPELTSEVVGRLFNTHMEGDKLKAEAWINISQLENISPEAYEDIKENKALDVSIGVYSDEVDIQGEFNNEEYRAVARNLRPDHLALLPGATGACSWDAGCGVRTNSKLKTNEVKNLKTLSSKELLEEGIGIHLISNVAGFREIIRTIQRKLDQLDGNGKFYYLDEIFDTYIVYRVENTETQNSSYYRRDYTVQQDGSVEFTTDPVQVRKEVSFVVMESGKLKRTNFSNNNKLNNSMEGKIGCPNKVGALIAHSLTQFTDTDKEWLSTLENSQLDMMLPKEVKAPVANAKKDTKEDAAKSEASTEGGPVKINSAELKKAVKAIFNESDDPSVFINEFMPEGLKGQMNSGLKMYHAKRKELIANIVANSKFEEAQLVKWEDADLQSLSDSVVPGADFSAAGENGLQIHGAEEVGEEGKSMLNIPVKKD